MGFLERHGIVKNAVKADLLYFALPGIICFAAGLIFSARDGWEGSIGTIAKLIKEPERIDVLTFHNYLGLLLTIMGFIIMFTAAFTLGRFYTSTLVIKRDHRLITHGIYHFVRHPIYLGVIMVCLGVPVYVLSGYGFLAMSLLIPVFLIRIRMEEQLLIEQFGDSYRDYQQKTARIFPFF